MYRPTPQLVTLEGDFDDDYEDGYNSLMGSDPEVVAELLGIDIDDADLITSTDYLSGEDIQYLEERYPEYMGIWPWLAKVGAALVSSVGTIVKGIANRVKSKREAREAAAAAEAERLRLEAEKKEQQKKMLLYAGGAIALIFILRKRKRR